MHWCKDKEQSCNVFQYDSILNQNYTSMTALDVVQHGYSLLFINLNLFSIFLYAWVLFLFASYIYQQR